MEECLFVGEVLFICGPGSKVKLLGPGLSSIVSAFIGNKCRIAICPAREDRSTMEGIDRCARRCSLIAYDNKSNALSRIIANVVVQRGGAPVKCVPTKAAGSFTDDLRVSGGVLRTTSAVMAKAPFSFSVNRFGSSCFMCVTTFNVFASISCRAGRDVGGVLNRVTCVLRKAGELFGVPSCGVGIVRSKRAVRSRFVFKVIAGSHSMKKFGEVAKRGIVFSSNIFRIALFGAPGGPIRLGRLLKTVIVHRVGSSEVCSFGDNRIHFRSIRTVP